MKKPAVLGIAAVVVVLLCILGWSLDPAAFLAAWLAAWWWCTGIALGALANVWLHNLTGGNWGEAIRPQLLGVSRMIWAAVLLFLPVLLGMHDLYPWAQDADSGVARFAADLSVPAFKSAWLMPGFFALRSVLYLVLWIGLALLSRRPGLQRSRPFSAVALILYGISVSLASVDWIMSLMPLWYSSIFGLLVGTAQMLGGMALAIVLVAFRANPPPPALLRDLGNLLLMYVLTWAYLAFMQFLIIWAEILPHEIAWYLPRAHGVWLAVAWLRVLFLFAVPLLILLSRRAKQTPRMLGTLAAALLAMLLVDAWWLVLPSLPLPGGQWLWAAPLAAVALGGAALFSHRYWQPPLERKEAARA